MLELKISAMSRDVTSALNAVREYYAPNMESVTIKYRETRAQSSLVWAVARLGIGVLHRSSFARTGGL